VFKLQSDTTFLVGVLGVVAFVVYSVLAPLMDILCYKGWSPDPLLFN